MRHDRIIPAIAFLVFASLACQAVSGPRNNDGNKAPSSNTGGNQPGTIQPTDAQSNPGVSGSDSTVSTEFPMTPDAYNVTDLGNGSILYYSKLSAEDTMNFYRDEYTSLGYKERKILTTVSDKTFNLVFDGDPSGKSVIVQSVDLGDGSRTITVRLETINQ